jgi:hypothetical protein
LSGGFRKLTNLMSGKFLIVLATGVLWLWVPVSASAEFKIYTSDTKISVEARANAPRLLRIEGRRGAVWTNRAPEELIPFVELNDRQVPTTWRLKSDAIQSDPHRLLLVYENASPHLEATWLWQARSDFGPIEHGFLRGSNGHISVAVCVRSPLP